MPKDEYWLYQGEKLLGFYKKQSKNRTLKRVVISDELLPDMRQSVICFCICQAVKAHLTAAFSQDFVVYYDYYNHQLVIREVSQMTMEIVAYFPYEDYDLFLPKLITLNQLLGEENYLELFINNVPFTLTAGVLITCDSFSQTVYDNICENLKTLGFAIDTSKGSEELFQEFGGRQYQLITIPYGASLEQLQALASWLFFFPPKSVYEAKGYCFTPKYKPKLFVSYSHRNQPLVHDIIKQLRRYGFDFWLDEEQIDVGDRLLERVHQGVSECDLALVFLSQDTKVSAFAKHELHSFFSQVIYQNSISKKWFIIRLDDVDPNEICFGLGDFKYIDYNCQHVEVLVNALTKKLASK